MTFLGVLSDLLQGVSYVTSNLGYQKVTTGRSRALYMYLGCEFPPSNDDNYNNPKPQEKNKSQLVSQFVHSFSPVEIGENNQLLNP